MPIPKTKKEAYQILELPEDASDQQVKKTYKKLAKKWHPDKNPGVETAEKFKEIQAAYSILNPTATNVESQENATSNAKPSLWNILESGTAEQIKEAIGSSTSKLAKDINWCFSIILERNDIEIVRFFLKVFQPQLNQTCKPLTVYSVGREKIDSRLLLHFAIETRLDSKIIELLLERGANPNLKDDYSDHATAFQCALKNPAYDHYASKRKYRRADYVAFLLAHKANVNLPIEGFFGRNHHSSILNEAIHCLNSCWGRSRRPCNTEFTAELKQQLLAETEDCLDSLQLILLHGADINFLENRYSYKSTALDLIKNYHRNINPIPPSKLRMFIFREKNYFKLTNGEETIALDSLKRAENAIYCRKYFDKAAQKLRANKKWGVRKYLLKASQYDLKLYQQLVEHLLQAKGQFKDLKLQPEQTKFLCSLPIVREHAMETTRELIKTEKASSDNLTAEHIKQEKKRHLIIQGTASTIPEVKDDKAKLQTSYGKLVVLQKEQMQDFAALVKQYNTNNRDSFKTCEIKEWDQNTWWALQQNQKYLDQTLSTAESEIHNQNKSLLAPYQPLLYNMQFFNFYLTEGISHKQKHNAQRIAFCLYFMLNMEVKLADQTPAQPIITLLGNLYTLKGLLLAEVHVQSYKKNLVNCAATSALFKHVDKEIRKIERMLVKSPKTMVTIEDNNPLNEKKKKIQDLDKAYGTAFRRLKTVLFTDKKSIQCDAILETRETALSHFKLNKCNR